MLGLAFMVAVQLAPAHTFLALAEAAPSPVLSEDAIIQSKVLAYADRYAIDYATFYKVIDCESGFDPGVQSQWITKAGTQEESYGLAQINLPAHPDVSKEEATDPDFALNFMADQFSRGHFSMWSCYTLLKRKGSI